MRQSGLVKYRDYMHGCSLLEVIHVQLFCNLLISAELNLLKSGLFTLIDLGQPRALNLDVLRQRLRAGPASLQPPHQVVKIHLHTLILCRHPTSHVNVEDARILP